MNNTQQAINELFDLQKFAIKLGLHNITRLSYSLGNPHLKYPAIHIAGTNGKGSTAIILQQILMKHGLKVGLFTSPHLVDFNERIRIDDELISNDFIVEFWEKMKKLVLDLKATFFDTTTCMAFDYFSQKKVDVAIFETGLGGRLDSTNIIQPEAAVITPIDFDHQKQLGYSLSSIAAEKAGIIKPGCKLFLGLQKGEVLNYFRNYKYNKNEVILQEENLADLKIESDINRTSMAFIDKWRNVKFENVELNLMGKHQAHNACLSYLTGRWYLEKLNIEFNERNFKNALSGVKWNGRIQKISISPDIYVDVSHNVDGFRKTMEYIIENFEKKKTSLLLGLLDDKNYKDIVAIVKNAFNNIIVTEPENYRKLDGYILLKEIEKYRINVKFIKDVKKSFEISIKELKQNESLFVIGSHYLAGSILKTFGK